VRRELDLALAAIFDPIAAHRDAWNASLWFWGRADCCTRAMVEEALSGELFRTVSVRKSDSTKR
jgi:hypothetical protein